MLSFKRLLSISCIPFCLAIAGCDEIDGELIIQVTPSEDPIPTSQQADFKMQSEQYQLTGSLPQVNQPYSAQSGVYQHESQ